MKITRLSAYQVDLPLHDGIYAWSDGKSITAFDSTIVRIETDAGLVGWGESCPLGPVYLPSYAGGVRGGIAELGPRLLGQDPTQLERLNHTMDMALKGHPYAKSGIDIACWDILGKAAGMPVCELLGGRYGEDVALYRSVSRDTPEAMAAKLKGYRAQGHHKFQLKVGGIIEEDIERIRACAAETEPGDTLIADANTGWLMHEAARIVRAVADIDVYIEQPCPSYEECLAIRRRTDLPFVLDECMEDIGVVVRGHADGAMDAINLKISRFGGLTRARQVRDLCVSLGIALTTEDAGGGDVTNATVAHLAHSTPEKHLLSVTLAGLKVSLKTADGAPEALGGRVAASRAPGLGITPLPEVLGDPVIDLR
jgi:L-alanine-DL-glutamate epimerase-like enolase superfamily enzyme